MWLRYDSDDRWQELTSLCDFPFGFRLVLVQTSVSYYLGVQRIGKSVTNLPWFPSQRISFFFGQNFSKVTASFRGKLPENFPLKPFGKSGAKTLALPSFHLFSMEFIVVVVVCYLDQRVNSAVGRCRARVHSKFTLLFGGKVFASQFGRSFFR